MKVKVTENLAAGSTADGNVRNQAGIQGGALARTSPGGGLDVAGGKLLLFYASNQEGPQAAADKEPFQSAWHGLSQVLPRVWLRGKKGIIGHRHTEPRPYRLQGALEI